MLFLSQMKILVFFKVALKRQQAAEDKIALHLASVESGTALEALPPGRIYGMRVTGPCPSPGPEPDSAADDQTVSRKIRKRNLGRLKQIIKTIGLLN